MSVAACSRVAGSSARRASVVARHLGANRGPKVRVRTSTAVSGVGGLGESSRCGSPGGGQVQVVFVGGPGHRDIEVLAGQHV